MPGEATWQGEARLTYGASFEARVTARVTSDGDRADWSGELVLPGVAAILPGDHVQLVVERSPCRAIVREAIVRGGAGHRTTTLLVDGEGPPPAPLRPR